jgi:tripartite-type tricarboxylate transporter receptor subunit TctC
MKNNRLKTNAYNISVIVLLMAASFHAYAQTSWPAKPIRVIVPFPPGGTSDILARLVGQKLTDAWGQQIIVDARPGATGTIGTDMVVRAPVDGHTLLLTDLGNLVITPMTLAKVPYDPHRDLAPIATVSYSPHLLVVHPSVPAKTVLELVALAKKNPGKLNAPAALSSAPHLAGLMVQSRMGVKWTTIPTKGGAHSMLTLATGEGDLMFLGMLQTLAHVRSGRARVLAITSEKRDPALPNTPTVAETPGLEGFHTGSWQGILGPARLPADIVNKAGAEVRRALAMPDVKEKLVSQGTEPLIMTPPEMGKWLASEKDRWAKVIKDSGLKVE